MKKIYILYLFIVLCAFSCLEDANMPGERQNVDFPILTIPEKPDTITYNSTILSANIESANGYEITARGFIYSLDNSLKEGRDSISISLGTENGLGNFKYEINGLSLQTQYYYVAFATNEKGTQYSKVLSFTTWATPTVETGEPKDISNGDAVITGTITSIGAAPIEEYGICFSLTSDPAPTYGINDTISAPVNGNKFEILLTKLAGSRTYYVRTYAINSYGISYGQTRQLQTPEVWERVADFGRIDGKGRISYTTFTISDYFYITAGEDVNSIPLNDLWEYNPSTNIWSNKTNFFGSPRKAPSSFVIGNRGYTGFGISATEANLSDFYAYQQNKNEWSNIEKPFPGKGREYACSFSINNSGYIVGGRVTGEGEQKLTSLSDAWKYEYNGNTWGWNSIANFPVPIQEGLSFSYQNKAFIGLGGVQVTEVSYYNKIWMYDPTSNLWTEVSTVPAEFNYTKGGITGVTVVENNAYIIDGNNRIWIFNLDSYEWSKKSEMPISRADSDNQCMFSYRNESKNEHEIFVGLNRYTKYFYKYRPSWDNPVK